MEKKYRVACNGCGEVVGETDDPQQAYDMRVAASEGEHGADATVTARGLINRARFARANKGR